MSTSFVSIVTPVYNDAEYLEQCIRSVLAQTHEDFEYIICDNHSKDRSLEIASDYASRDPRIRVVQPGQFVPQAPNFNFALQQISARSSYTKMLLSDDWLFPRCVEELVRVSVENPSVGLASSYRLIETTPDGFGLRPERTFFTGREAARAHLIGAAYAFGNPTQVLYRSDIVRKRAPAFFPEQLLNFDMDIGFIILKDHDFGFVHQVLSYSRLQEGAMSHGIASFNNWFVSRYMEVLDYGPAFLEQAEYSVHLYQVTRQFYTGLGEVWLKDRVRLRKRKDFWEFQRRQLASTGRKIDRKLLVRGIGAAALGYLSNPADLVRTARDATQRRR